MISKLFAMGFIVGWACCSFVVTMLYKKFRRDGALKWDRGKRPSFMR